MTRSSIKPRLLFPPEQKNADGEVYGTDDEEALTDIEEAASVTVPFPREDFETPQELEGDTPATPAAPRFFFLLIRRTDSSTRQGSKAKIEDSPMKSRPAKTKSPFDVWRRSRSSAAHGQKREGDPLAQGVPTAAKRQKTSGLI